MRSASSASKRERSGPLARCPQLVGHIAGKASRRAQRDEHEIGVLAKVGVHHAGVRAAEHLVYANVLASLTRVGIARPSANFIGGLGGDDISREAVRGGLVVVADVEHVVVAIDGAGERLQANVRRAAVAGKAHHGDILRRGALGGR